VVLDTCATATSWLSRRSPHSWRCGDEHQRVLKDGGSPADLEALLVALREETEPISCADLINTCGTTVQGAAHRDVLLGYIGHTDREHRQDALPLDAVLDAISDKRLTLTAAARS
jgi:hypothetical protein